MLGKAYGYGHDLNIEGSWEKSSHHLEMYIKQAPQDYRAYLYLAKNYMDERAIIEMLRNADKWPYRVLEMAKKISQEVSNVEASSLYQRVQARSPAVTGSRREDPRRSCPRTRGPSV